MKLWENPEVRRLTLIFLALAVLAPALCFAAGAAQESAKRGDYRLEMAGVVGAVAEHYPEAVTGTLNVLAGKNVENTENGLLIMRQYGFDEVSYPDKNGAVFGALPYAALFVALLAAVFITMLLFLRAFFRRIVGLTEYAKRLQSRDYSLDIRDNDEGVISIYKNEIFKITGLLREQAEQSGTEKRMLSDTLYNISHQLKTPLTSLFVLTDLLNDGRDISERQEFIARIRAQLKRIEWLVSSLLKLSRLDSDTVIMKRQTLPLSKLVSRAAEPLLIPMELREQTLSLRGEDGIEITGDLNWLAEAVGNILKNCMEHTPKGGEITVSYEQNRLFRELRIEDTGGGIAPEDLPHIFERFYRGRRAGADSVGIGLAMAKSIIEKNGGSIQAYNSDAGAVFILRFMTD